MLLVRAGDSGAHHRCSGHLPFPGGYLFLRYRWEPVTVMVIVTVLLLPTGSVVTPGQAQAVPEGCRTIYDQASVSSAVKETIMQSDWDGDRARAHVGRQPGRLSPAA
jgi:hypothetical protein